MALSARELRELRLLARELRIADPRLARAMLRGSSAHTTRWAAGCAALLASIALLLVGTVVACFLALPLSLAGTLVLRPLLRE